MTTKEVLQQELEKITDQLIEYSDGGTTVVTVERSKSIRESILRVVEAALIEFESKNAGENILTGNKVTPEMYQIGKLMASLRQEGGNEL